MAMVDRLMVQSRQQQPQPEEHFLLFLLFNFFYKINRHHTILLLASTIFFTPSVSSLLPPPLRSTLATMGLSMDRHVQEVQQKPPQTIKMWIVRSLQFRDSNGAGALHSLSGDDFGVFH